MPQAAAEGVALGPHFRQQHHYYLWQEQQETLK
jgi:hypothetical protein